MLDLLFGANSALSQFCEMGQEELSLIGFFRNICPAGSGHFLFQDPVDLALRSTRLCGSVGWPHGGGHGVPEAEHEVKSCYHCQCYDYYY